jgi:hypothetical protein
MRNLIIIFITYYSALIKEDEMGHKKNEAYRRDHEKDLRGR